MHLVEMNEEEDIVIMIADGISAAESWIYYVPLYRVRFIGICHNFLKVVGIKI